ncbi:hypothetical protein ACLG6S_15345 [Thermodesulfobacteriota bacterium B35]
MEQLVQLVMDKTGISEEHARNAVSVVIAFVQEKLPEPLSSQVESLLNADEGSEGGGVAGALKGMLGS